MVMILKNSEPQLRVSRDWDEVLKVASTGEDRLTYVPGLVGDIIEWIVATSMLPNRMMALGVALAVVGGLISRKVLGPSNSMTHLFTVLLAPTGAGKQDPMQRGRELIAAVVEEDAGLIIGDTTWQSAPGIEKMLDECPVRICFVDEVGDELGKINSTTGNPFVSATTGLLKKIYNGREYIQTGRTKHAPGVIIHQPAYNLVCAATPGRFWSGLGGGDLESGVVNRFLILPVMDTPTGKLRVVPYETLKPPRWLVEELRKLPRWKLEPLNVLDIAFSTKDDKPIIKWSEVDNWIHQTWDSQEVCDVWLAASNAMLEEKNEKKQWIGKRGGEHAIRAVSSIVAGCDRTNITMQDVTWGLAVASRSIDVAYEGAQKFLQTYLHFPEMCQEIYDDIVLGGGFRSTRYLIRKYPRKDRWGHGLYSKAIAQLQLEGRLTQEVKRSTGGRPTVGYEVREEKE